jgi:hypothetical protein
MDFSRRVTIRKPKFVEVVEGVPADARRSEALLLEAQYMFPRKQERIRHVIPETSGKRSLASDCAFTCQPAPLQGGPHTMSSIQVQRRTAARARMGAPTKVY